MTMLPTSYDDRNVTDKTPKSRSRSGCLTCRRRRLKCDEKLPKCGNCVNNERACQWGLQASFHASRMRGLSASESAFILSLEAKQRRPAAVKFVDNTEEIQSGYVAYGHSPEDSAGFDDEDCLTISSEPQQFPNQIDDNSAELRQGAESFSHLSNISAVVSPETSSDTTAHTGSFITAGITIPGQESDARHGDWFLHDVQSSNSSPAMITTASSIPNDKMPLWPINEGTKARLIASYLKETSTWCETTDTLRHFSVESAPSILASQALSATAAAVASRQIDNRKGVARVETIELYDFARETICCLEAWQNDEIVLASAVQLCVYCMMSMEVNEWRLHLRGCAGTFQEMGWNGSSGGLPSACFWAFARIDIWAAYLTRQTTLIPTDFWMAPGYQDIDSFPLQDRYANKAIWIFARIINQLSERGEPTSDGVLRARETSTQIFSNLWRELDAWHRERPACVKSIVEVDPNKENAFPFILFGNPSAICGNIFYHTGCLLLLETAVRNFSPNDPNSVTLNHLWHARRIGGISTTTDDHPNWVNNLQPVFIAARYYTEASEKIAILKHLRDIELSTGWKTGSRSTELRELWGLG